MDSMGIQVLIVATTGPEAPERCTTPFFFALEAAHTGASVVIYSVLRSAHLT